MTPTKVLHTACEECRRIPIRSRDGTCIRMLLANRREMSEQQEGKRILRIA